MAVLHQLSFEKPLYELEERLLKLESQHDPSPAEKESMRRMRVELTQMTRERYSNLDPWQTVQVSRHPDRPRHPTIWSWFSTSLLNFMETRRSAMIGP